MRIRTKRTEIATLEVRDGMRKMLAAWEFRRDVQSGHGASCAFCKKHLLGEKRNVAVLVDEEHRKDVPLIFINACSVCGDMLRSRLSELFANLQPLSLNEVEKILDRNNIPYKERAR